MRHPKILWTTCPSVSSLTLYPIAKNFFLLSNLSLPSFQFKAIALCCVTTGPGKKSFSVFLTSLLCILKGSNKVSPEPSVLQATKPQLSQSIKFCGSECTSHVSVISETPHTPSGSAECLYRMALLVWLAFLRHHMPLKSFRANREVKYF